MGDAQTWCPQTIATNDGKYIENPDDSQCEEAIEDDVEFIKVRREVINTESGTIESVYAKDSLYVFYQREMPIEWFNEVNRRVGSNVSVSKDESPYWCETHAMGSEIVHSNLCEMFMEKDVKYIQNLNHLLRNDTKKTFSYENDLKIFYEQNHGDEWFDEIDRRLNDGGADENVVDNIDIKYEEQSDCGDDCEVSDPLKTLEIYFFPIVALFFMWYLYSSRGE